MKYFSINNSFNPKVLGHYPQVKDIKQNCHVWDEPRFIEHVHFTEINFEPIIANAILYPSSKLTDLVSVTGMGFTLKPLISGKLKSILKEVRKSHIQFFKSPIIQKDKLFEDYYILNMFENGNHFIDIKACRIRHDKKAKDYNLTYNTNTEYLEFEDLNSFNVAMNEALKNEETFFIDQIYLIENVTEDFFMLNQVQGGVKYIVSEKLKQEIEDASCTGIEFQPVELSYNEWTAPGGEREKVYGKI